MIIKNVDLMTESNRIVSNRANNNFLYGALLVFIGLIGCISIYKKKFAIVCLILIIGGLINLMTGDSSTYYNSRIGWFLLVVGFLGIGMVLIEHSRGSGSSGGDGGGCSSCGGGSGGCSSCGGGCGGGE